MSDIDNNKLTNYLRLKKMTHLRKELSFIDLLFLSLGGQAPFLSLLTYATSVIIYSLLFSPIVVLLGTLIVLLNGLVVFKLSRKYEETGGYYIYAMYSLTRRLGLETGWMYIFYSSFYGTAYLVGSSFVLHYVFGFSPILALFVSIIPASVFLLMGLRPSAKYAEISGVVEILIIVAVFFVGIYLAHFRFYNPLQRVPSISDISLAILFAIGIPTGYGSITPLSGETINTKDVGKAILYVIIIGGFVASLGVYGLIDMGLYTNQLSIIFKSSIPILDIMKSNLGIYSIIIMIYAAISDGILASLSFMLGTSRTIYAMAQKDMLPSVFTW
ncbi:MAG: APC family permease, partial [Caldisphaera sp.]|nr:APC family permease [Caldisphaera sp.]